MSPQEKIKTLRSQANLTNAELAERAKVPISIVSGLQTGYRSVGERQARRIGLALDFQGKDLEDFVLMAINTCSEKVLSEFKGYPSELINLMLLKLRESGILSDDLNTYVIDGGGASLTLHDGRTARINTSVQTS